MQIGILQLTPWYPLGQQCAVATAAAEAAAAGVGIDVKRSRAAAAAAGARDVPFLRQLSSEEQQGQHSQFLHASTLHGNFGSLPHLASQWWSPRQPPGVVSMCAHGD